MVYIQIGSDSSAKRKSSMGVLTSNTTKHISHDSALKSE